MVLEFARTFFNSYLLPTHSAEPVRRLGCARGHTMRESYWVGSRADHDDSLRGCVVSLKGVGERRWACGRWGWGGAGAVVAVLGCGWARRSGGSGARWGRAEPLLGQCDAADPRPMHGVPRGDRRRRCWDGGGALLRCAGLQERTWEAFLRVLHPGRS